MIKLIINFVSYSTIFKYRMRTGFYVVYSLFAYKPKLAPNFFIFFYEVKNVNRIALKRI